jgi:hypothetical protein
MPSTPIPAVPNCGAGPRGADAVRRLPERSLTRLRPGWLAPSVARRIVRQTCELEQLPPLLIDAAAMTAGELVTVSVQQARTHLDLLVVVEANAILVTVHDGFTSSPISAQNSMVRGLPRSIAVVNRLSTCWGCLRLGTGRELWAVVATEWCGTCGGAPACAACPITAIGIKLAAANALPPVRPAHILHSAQTSAHAGPSQAQRADLAFDMRADG